MENIADFLILTLLEVILGIDNILFISITVQNVKRKDAVRYIGLSLALLIRIIMLIYIKSLLEFDMKFINISVRNLILTIGGIFLIIKSGQQIYKDIFYNQEKNKISSKENFYYAILQVVSMDLIFSLDSVLTAIALTKNIIIIVIAFAVAMIVMIKFSNYSVSLLQNFPRLKMLALMFIAVLGLLLLAEGFNIHTPKEYLYISFTFSLIAELLNLILEKNQHKN
ncbi:MAG: TerC family protein [Rickettsiaceae bacterium H1]|nr:TerC family protein [Rickettsiaceae bacterium H1]